MSIFASNLSAQDFVSITFSSQVVLVVMVFLFQLFTCKEELKMEMALKIEAVEKKAAIQQLLHVKSKVDIFAS